MSKGKPRLQKLWYLLGNNFQTDTVRCTPPIGFMREARRRPEPLGSKTYFLNYINFFILEII